MPPFESLKSAAKKHEAIKPNELKELLTNAVKKYEDEISQTENDKEMSVPESSKKFKETKAKLVKVKADYEKYLKSLTIEEDKETVQNFLKELDRILKTLNAKIGILESGTAMMQRIEMQKEMNRQAYEEMYQTSDEAEALLKEEEARKAAAETVKPEVEPAQARMLTSEEIENPDIIKNIEELSAANAKILVQVKMGKKDEKGRTFSEIILPRVRKITKEAAAELANFDGPFLELGITEMTVDVAEELGKSKAYRIKFKNLIKINPKAAASLVRYRGWGYRMALNGLIRRDPSVMAELAKYKGEIDYVNTIETVTDKEKETLKREYEALIQDLKQNQRTTLTYAEYLLLEAMLPRYSQENPLERIIEKERDLRDIPTSELSGGFNFDPNKRPKVQVGLKDFINQLPDEFPYSYVKEAFTPRIMRKYSKEKIKMPKPENGDIMIPSDYGLGNVIPPIMYIGTWEKDGMKGTKKAKIIY